MAALVINQELKNIKKSIKQRKQQSNNNSQGTRNTPKITELNGKQMGNDQGRRSKLKIKIGTWNICGLRNKEPEIIEFMMKHNITIMGIADCRKKGKNMKITHNNYIISWSGVEIRQRSVHGVGFILHPDIAKHIKNIEFVSERII